MTHWSNKVIVKCDEQQQKKSKVKMRSKLSKQRNYHSPVWIFDSWTTTKNAERGKKSDKSCSFFECKRNRFECVQTTKSRMKWKFWYFSKQFFFSHPDKTTTSIQWRKLQTKCKRHRREFRKQFKQSFSHFFAYFSSLFFRNFQPILSNNCSVLEWSHKRINDKRKRFERVRRRKLFGCIFVFVDRCRFWPIFDFSIRLSTNLSKTVVSENGKFVFWFFQFEN